MPAIQFPLSSDPGITPQDGGGRLINTFVEKTGAVAKNEVKWLRRPGSDQWGTASGLPSDPILCRGMLPLDNDTLYVVYQNRAVKFDAAGTATDLGLFPGTRHVSIARNQNSDEVQVLACGEYGLSQIFPDRVESFFSPTLEDQTPVWVGFVDGYFIVACASGQWFISNLNSVVFDPLQFATAESSPDGLVWGAIYDGEVILYGTKTTECYRNSGASPFPFERSVRPISRGAASPYAIGGFHGLAGEETDPPISVGDDDRVYQWTGGIPKQIGTPPVVRAISRLADKSVLESSGFISGPHKFWCLSCPDWTWCYELETGQWFEAASVGFNRWRLSQSVQAFGKRLAGDFITAKIYEVGEQFYDDDGQAIISRLLSGPMHDFPNRTPIDGCHLDFATGRGNAAATNPQVMLRWSKDGGMTFSNVFHIPVGESGQYGLRMRKNRLGLAGSHGLVVEASWSDPIITACMGGEITAKRRGPE